VTLTSPLSGAAVTGSVTVAATATDNLGVVGVDPLTVSAWIRTSATTGLKGIVNKYWPGSFDGWQVFLNGGTLCAWYVRDSANAVWDGSGCTLATPGYADGLWHHVVFVVDHAGGRLYVDGVQRASQAWKGVAGEVTTTQALSLGQYPGTASPYLSGVMEEVRIYNRALTGEEILALSTR
jgi:hypothetical protein